MKSRGLMWFTGTILLAVLAIPVRLAAQEQQQAGPNGQHFQHYTVIDLGTLGGTFSQAFGINNKGCVVGFATLTGDTALHAFLRRKGVMTDLGTLGGPNSRTFTNSSVNERDEVVGAAESSAPDPLGENFFLCGFNDGLLCLPFVWQDGAMRPLPTLGGNNGLAFAMNDRGGVVGTAENNTLDPTCVAPGLPIQACPLGREQNSGAPNRSRRSRWGCLCHQ